MAYPTKEKTWQFSVNMPVGDTGNANYDGGSFYLAIKNALVGFASSPWTVWGSSDSTAYGNNDGVDRWTDHTKVVWATSGAHSWIVLKQSGLGTNAAICLDYVGVSRTYATIVLFPTGVGTAGTVSARPSATDEVVMCAAGYPGVYSSNPWCGYVHVMQSTDGQCTRVLTSNSYYVYGFYRGVSGAFWLFDRVKNPSSAWTLPIVGILVQLEDSAENTTYSKLNDTSTYGFGRVGADLCKFYCASEGWGSATVGENISVCDDDDSTYTLPPVQLVSASVGSKGCKGELYDLWWGPSSVRSGECYPEDGTRALVQYGHLVLPWDGSSYLQLLSGNTT